MIELSVNVSCKSATLRLKKLCLHARQLKSRGMYRKSQQVTNCQMLMPYTSIKKPTKRSDHPISANRPQKPHRSFENSNRKCFDAEPCIFLDSAQIMAKVVTNCGKLGHFTHLCKQPRRQPAAYRPQVGLLNEHLQQNSQEELHLGCLTACSVTVGTADWSETVSVNGHEVTLKLDSGSDINIIPVRMFTQWPCRPATKPTTTKVTTYSGQQLPIDSKCELACAANSRVC